MDLNKQVVHDASHLLELCILNNDLASSFDVLLDRCQRVILEQCLRSTRGNQVRAAELMKINRNTLHRWIIKYKLNIQDYKHLDLNEVKKRINGMQRREK